jgi:hypothetical protein
MCSFEILTIMGWIFMLLFLHLFSLLLIISRLEFKSNNLISKLENRKSTLDVIKHILNLFKTHPYSNIYYNTNWWATDRLNSDCLKIFTIGTGITSTSINKTVEPDDFNNTGTVLKLYIESDDALHFNQLVSDFIDLNKNSQKPVKIIYESPLVRQKAFEKWDIIAYMEGYHEACIQTLNSFVTYHFFCILLSILLALAIWFLCRLSSKK